MTTDTVNDLAAQVERARQAVLQARATLAEWEAKKQEAQEELDALQESAGAELLDDAGAEDALMDRQQRLRFRIEAAGRAITAQRPRVTVAESRYLAAEADALEPRIAEALAAHQAHKEKAAKLLKQLEDLEGCSFIPEDKWMNLLRSVDAYDGPTSWRVPRSSRVDTATVKMQRQVEVLRALAAGRHVEDIIRGWRLSPSAILPDCVYGPEALVPADAYLESVEHAKGWLAELEGIRDRLPAEIEEWEAKERDQQWRASEYGAADVTLGGLDRRRRRLESIDEEIAQARTALAQFLTSSDD